MPREKVKMVEMDPARARAFLRSFKEHDRLANQYSRRADLDNRPDVVYYIQFRDALKIGTTLDLEKRLEALPWEVLLGLEPGGRKVEQHRHRQFRHHRYMDEWFYDVPAIRNHVEALNLRNAEWLAEAFPKLSLPHQYPGRHKHAYA